MDVFRDNYKSTGCKSTKNNYKLTFEELLLNYESNTIHLRNLKYLLTEIYQYFTLFKSGICSYQNQYIPYNLRITNLLLATPESKII